MKEAIEFIGNIEADFRTLAQITLPSPDPQLLCALPTGATDRWKEFFPLACWLVGTLRPSFICSLHRMPEVSYPALCQAVVWAGLDTRCYAVGPREMSSKGREFRVIHDELYEAFSTLLDATAYLGTASNSIPAGSLGLLSVDLTTGTSEVDRTIEVLSAKFAANAVVLVHGSRRRFRDLNYRLQWNALTNKYPYFEFTQGDGLGVIAIGDSVPQSIAELCSQADNVAIEDVRRRLVEIGVYQEGKADEEAPSSAALEPTVSTVEDIDGQRLDIAIWRRKSRDAERARAEMALRLNVARRDIYAANMRAEQALSELESKNEQVLAELEHKKAILSSRAWHVTRPFRQLAERHPKLARLIWRTMRLFWWCLSLQLLARYREWRNRSLAVGAQHNLLDKIDAPSPPEQPYQPNDVMQKRHIVIADAMTEWALQANIDYSAFLASGRRLSFERTGSPWLSIILALNDNPSFAFRSLEALLLQRNVPPFELITLRDASNKKIEELLSLTDAIRLVDASNTENQLQAFNKAATLARGQALLFADADTFLQRGALAVALQTLASAQDIGAVGGRILAPSGRVHAAGGIIWSDSSLCSYGQELVSDAGEVMFRRDIDFSGTPLLVASEAWQRIEQYNGDFEVAAYGQADLAVRLREAGLRVVYEPSFVATFSHNQNRPNIPSQWNAALRQSHSLFRLLHEPKLRSGHLPPPSADLLVARERRPAGQRRLLMIDNEVPFTALGAGYPRAKEMLRVAVAAGWAVTLYPFRKPQFDWNSAQMEFPPNLEIIPHLGVAGLASFLKARQGFYDVVLISRPDNMELVHRTLSEAPELLGGARLVYDAEAVFATRAIIKAKLDGNPFSAKREEELYLTEAGLTAGVDAITCVTEAEAEFFRQRSRATVHVVNHPVVATADSPGFIERTGFIFVGRLLEHAAPNWQGLSWFVRECWPLIRATLPNATLAVAGHLNPDHAVFEVPGIRLLGAVSDLAPYYDASRVFIAPIQFAAGVSIKILEATGAGLPVAATRLMACQLGWQNGRDIVAEDDIQALSRGCIALHEDFDFWNSMRAAAVARLQSEYSPDQFRKKLEAALG